MIKLNSLKIRIIIGIIFIIYLIIPFSIEAAEYSLIDIYKIALVQSERIQMAQLDLYISQKGQEKAVAGLLPKVTAFGMYQTSGVSEGYPGYGIKTYGLELDKTMSLGGAEIIAYKMSKIAIDKSEHDLKTVKADYLLEVTTSFINILRAIKAVEICEINVARLKNHRDAALIRLKVGETIKTAVLRAEAELSGANADLIKAQNGLKLAKAVLARLIGITEDYSIVETQEFVDLDDSQTINQLKDMGIQNRMEVKSLELTGRILDQNINIAKSSFWPVLSFQLAYSNMFLTPAPQYINAEGLYVGLSISYPIFEGGIRRMELNEAEANRRKAALALSELKKSLQIEIESIYSEYITQKEVLTSIASQVEFAKDNYNLVSKQFQYGLVTSLDVMDANNVLSRSETALVDTRYNYQLLLVKLKRATGTLLPDIETKMAEKHE
ncbi:MAG: TolC family protein [Nitrospirae bacterium]|nr:TolC family protein [Nitrospirota bacterium]